jgi:peptide/nickel transport system permease protein
MRESAAPAAVELLDELSVASRMRRNLVVRGSLGSIPGRVGLALIAAVLAVALVGPAVSPHSPTAIVGLPFQPPSAQQWLGTDVLGRDVLSRYLWGGRTLLGVAVLATSIAYVVGISLGMAAGLRKGAFDLVNVWLADLVLSFPPIILVLVLLAAGGARLSIVVLGLAIVNTPRIIRIVRAVTIDVSTQEFIEAAVARGEGLLSILFREILPNIWTPVCADFGVRLTGAIILYSSVSYLGFGLAPPAADWGLMISENRVGLTLQPWVVLVPALTVALLAIAVNLVADAIARSAGRSVVERGA